MASLEQPRGGRIRLQGLQALALVRSRSPQWLENGTWVTVPDGAAQRTDSAANVLNAVLAAVRRDNHNPLRLQTLAWDASGSLTVSRGTSLFDLLSFARLHAVATPLPAASIPDTLAVRADAATRAALHRAGYETGCTPD
jgi:hypothetical protein